MQDVMTDVDVMETAETGEDTLRDKYLTFNLDGQVYAFELKYIIDIIGITQITRVPNIPDYIKGIINLRGKILPIVDVRLRFGKMEKEYDERTCIIVINLDDVHVGLIVDSVSEVIGIPRENVAPPPSFGSSAYNKYILGLGKVGNTVKLLLDCDKVLNDEMYVEHIPE